MLSDLSIKLIEWLIEAATLKPGDPNFWKIAQAFEVLKAELKHISGVKSQGLNGSKPGSEVQKMEVEAHPNTET